MSRHVADGGAPGWRHLLTGLVATGVCGALLAAPAAAAGGRAYEMVSPPAKNNGGVVFGQRASADGDALAFIMNAAMGPDTGAYGLAPYVSYRTPTGWAARPTMPLLRTEHRGTNSISAQQVDFNDAFTDAWVVTNDKVAPDDSEPVATGNLESGFDLYRMTTATHASTRITRPSAATVPEYGPGGASFGYAGQSRDGTHVVFRTSGKLLPESPVLPPGNATLYESVGGEIRVVAIGEDGQPWNGHSTLASENSFVGLVPSTTAISDDGSRIYWSAGSPGAAPLYLREDGERTFVLSKSRAAGDLGTNRLATFLAASRDGATAYFYSGSTLLDDATGGGIYRFDREGERLSFVAEAAGEGPARASEDGTRLYFTAANTPVAGQNTLYLWEQPAQDEAGQLTAVATVSPDSVPEDPRLRVSRSGRYALFTSRISLDPRHRAGVNAIYRYDVETGDRTCISCRPDGTVGTGDAALRPYRWRYAVSVTSQFVQPRNLTEDGRVYFQTDDALVTADTNNEADVYEYDAGRVTLLSTGRGPGTDFVDNSEDGRTVFFTTPESLVPTDVDGGYPDVYASRVGGGFPVPPAPPMPCSGDSCQGPFLSPPTLTTPGSADVVPDTTDDDPEPTTATFRPLRPSARQLRAFASSGQVTLSVRVSGPGSVLAGATARLGRSRRQVARGWARAGARGTVRVNLPLSKPATRQLAARKVLRVTVTVSHSGSDESRQISMTLRRPTRAASARRAAKVER